MIAGEFISDLSCSEETLTIKLPEVGLTIFYGDDIVLEEGNFQILLVDLDHESVSDVLNCEVLADGFELGDEHVIGD